MAQNELSDSDYLNKELSDSSDSSSEEAETPEKVATDYEKERQIRIAENKARMEVLGLRNIANSLMGSVEISNRKPKSKRAVKKIEDDDDYKPIDEFGGGNLSCSSEGSEDESFDHRKSRPRSRKVKKLSSGKPISMKQPTDTQDVIDEDEALMQAIALSLKDSAEMSDLQHCGSSQRSNVHSAASNKKGNGHFQDDNMRRKKKPFTSRVQMTENDVVIHFCQIDEAGKGWITLRDLERMAIAHDFTWTDKELTDMIRCFDSDRDGKLTLVDFQNIVQCCNMLPVPEDP